MAQAVSRRPVNAEAWVCDWVSPYGISGEESDKWQVFSENLGFSCQYHSTAAP
jgi:hypothetical protein